MLTRSLSLVHGASWGINGQIIFGTEVAGLFRVSESGEQPEVLTTLDPEQNETSHRWPFIIPGREAVLFVISTGQPRTTGQLAVLDLATREVRRLGVAGVSPHYVPTGHLVYAGADEALRAVPFDATSLEVTGNPVPLVDGVLVKDSGAADFDISDNGRLVYVPGNVVENDDTLVLVDRDGNAAPLIETPGAYYLPRLSPDGRRVAVVVGREIKICEIDSGRCPRLTADGQTPVWSPDEAQVAFTSNRGGDFLDLYLKPADGTAEAERLLERAGNQFPTSWSLDGVLAFSDIGDGGIDVLLLPLGGEPDTSFATSFTGSSATFSPNGRWVAYKSNESGDLQIWVRPYPGPGAPQLVSIAGGTEPVWSRDGDELFFREGDRLMAVEVDSESPLFDVGTPRFLFGGYPATTNSPPVYDVTNDGKSIMVRTDADSQPANEIHVVVN